MRLVLLKFQVKFSGFWLWCSFMYLIITLTNMKENLTSLMRLLLHDFCQNFYLLLLSLSEIVVTKDSVFAR